jgi:hypothetical protein
MIIRKPLIRRRSGEFAMKIAFALLVIVVVAAQGSTLAQGCERSVCW